jgi:tetratricopeptide (TPR) repeat protein
VSLAVILFLQIMPMVSEAQTQGKGKIRGVVYDAESGQPLPGVTVRLFCIPADAFHNPAPVTDKEGKWGAFFIKDGMWNVDFEKVGYENQKMSYRVSFNPNERQPLIETKLRQVKGMSVVESVASKIRKGDNLFAEKKYEEAKSIYLQLLQEQPDVYILNRNIGNCFFAQEDYEAALEYYKKVYNKQPDQPEILMVIANAYNNWGKKEEAVEWYKKIPVDEIRDIDTAYNAGVTFYNSGNPEEAIKYFLKAVEIDSQFADAYYQLGMANVALNRSQEAVDFLKKAIELAPDSQNAATAKSIIDALSKK